MDSIQTRRNAKIGSAVNNICDSLPDNFEIEIRLERYGGAVGLFFDGEEIDYPSNHESLCEELADALEHARELADVPSAQEGNHAS